MWLDEAGEVMEMFRGSFPLSVLLFVPLLILLSPGVGPAAAAQEFAVYRMQQYDLHGTAYGCRNALVNVEARPIESSMLTRRCVITRLRELTLDKYRDILSQGAGGLLVLLPRNMTDLNDKDKEHLLELEQDMLQEETQVPVYFTEETRELLQIYRDIKHAVNSDQAGSAAEALMSSASANGFQMVVAGPQAKALNDFQVVNIQGKLAGYGIEEQLPTIAIVAHYDAYGVAPGLAVGSDSNASGVVALLELARLFSKLYTNSRTHAKFNIVFLLSGAGKFNYQGTKRWIEDQLDTAESSILTDVSYVLCLEALGAGDTINLHVSKPPKEGSAGDIMLQNLKEFSERMYPEVKVDVVHKKINLADDYLSWEHERFSIRRLPAFTLSRLDSHKSLIRNSILDMREAVDTTVLARNVKVIAESLARHIFNLHGQGSLEIFNEGLQVEEGLVSAWLDFLSSQPRAAQLLTKDSSVVTTLEQTLARYLKDVRKVTFKADKRDPEFIFYDGSKYTMSAYNVKPAIFDLFLACGIAAYLGLMWLLVQNFGVVYSSLRKVMGPVKSKVQ